MCISVVGYYIPTTEYDKTQVYLLAIMLAVCIITASGIRIIITVKMFLKCGPKFCVTLHAHLIGPICMGY